jgi:hypothetical protein
MNTFMSGIHVLTKPIVIEEPEMPIGLPVSPEVIEIPIIFESPELTKYYIS